MASRAWAGFQPRTPGLRDMRANNSAKEIIQLEAKWQDFQLPHIHELLPLITNDFRHTSQYSTVAVCFENQLKKCCNSRCCLCRRSVNDGLPFEHKVHVSQNVVFCTAYIVSVQLHCFHSFLSVSDILQTFLARYIFRKGSGLFAWLSKNDIIRSFASSRHPVTQVFTKAVYMQ